MEQKEGKMIGARFTVGGLPRAKVAAPEARVADGAGSAWRWGRGERSDRNGDGGMGS
jgi:hypothetical protein